MDIHKPKPWHGRREFLKEVATIVLGVLIAIAAEQLVEQLHWVHAVHDEREALSSELKGNLEAVVFRRAQEVCIDRRLNELGGMF
ncbi:hypothetical protein, partial [Phenylobacterium sp.]|uniref:hypothetical protein n=1 Tax=Phenylobacterium sp. TaxID=1871053 RepID=UPI00122204FB